MPEKKPRNLQLAASDLPSCTSAIVGVSIMGCRPLTRFLRSTHLVATETAKITNKGDNHCLFWCRWQTDLSL
jgi:hypothetical protein